MQMISHLNAFWNVNPLISVLQEQENVKYNAQKYIIVILTQIPANSVQMDVNIAIDRTAQVVCLDICMFSNWQLVPKFAITLIYTM